MKNTHESGQAVVLLVLAVVGLVAFTALAIDGGMVYSDRRQAQSAADAASLAGGGFTALALENYYIYYQDFNCAVDIPTIMNGAITTAKNRALSNGYTEAEVSVTYVCEDNGSVEDRKYIDITTQITHQTDTAFIHLVYDGPAVNQVESTVRVRPRSPLALGYAVVALNPDSCQGQQNGTTFHGSAGVYVTGGGIFSNGCMRVNGTPLVEVSDGGVYYAGEFQGNPHDTHPHAQHTSMQIPPSAYSVPEPTAADCSGRWYNNLSGNLSPGLYCLEGDLRLNGNDTLIGDGVTLYIPNGKVYINGSATVQLTAPSRTPDPSPAIPGIVIYAPASNHNEIQITGNADSYFQGTVLAPGASCDMLGNATSNAYQTQVICWDVEVGGTNDTFVYYREENQYSKPASIDLTR